MIKNTHLIFGLIGFPVKHSFSPAMHNAAFKYLGIDAEYKLFEIEPKELKDFLLKPDKEFNDTENNSIRAGDVVGFNITIPHKIMAKEILEQKYPFPGFGKNLDKDYVQLIGSINAVKREDKDIKYWNTDALGFARSLREDLEFTITKDKNALVIGCGGAGRAVIACLNWENGGMNKIYAYDMNEKKMQEIKEYFSQFPKARDKLILVEESNISNILPTCELLVNASPVGMNADDGEVIGKKLLHRNLSVYDIVYNRKTKLIENAEILGLKSSGGLGMLLYQGVFAFNFWTNQEAPVKIMEKALKKEIEKCRK